jgi:hypothetical protein
MERSVTGSFFPAHPANASAAIEIARDADALVHLGSRELQRRCSVQ